MRLFHSPTSPFVRKVMACAIARGLESRIETIATEAWDESPDLTRVNPLSQVPALVTDDGLALFDSVVICEYLDSLGDAAPLFPPAGAGLRWQALKLNALADGMMDAAIRQRLEAQLPADPGRTKVMSSQSRKVSRALLMLEQQPPGPAWHIGGIAVACALGYLDFRFAALDWRARHPQLAAWHESIAARPELQRSLPPG